MGEDKSIMLVAFPIVFKINNFGKEIYKPYKNVVLFASTFENSINLTDVILWWSIILKLMLLINFLVFRTIFGILKNMT